MWDESVGDWRHGLLEAPREIGEPRNPKGMRHPLPAVLTLAVCAIGRVLGYSAPTVLG